MLARSQQMYPKDPAISHLHTGSLGFPLTSSKYWDVSEVQSC